MTNYKAIVIGGSAGSFQVVTKILSSLPQTFGLPIFLSLHRLKHVRSGFLEALSIKSNLPIIEPIDKEQIKPGRAYLAPANYHMMAEIGNSISLSTDILHHFSRPSIDLTFDSFSYIYKQKMLSIIYSLMEKL